ncbi:MULTISPECIES: type II toxin-antitoxin system antitoxin HipB [Vibrio]|uniref:Transcriptional regulator n=1 Tax=Vibrio lentus TaxID=136468 RepID=A0A1B9PSB5_9VIBR|nr:MULTISPECIES: type II toxin-antitoxin system antitoxin HipB [Vibrio]OCH47870.1 transcriptional regulator [Vibrio lentus]PME55870.1 transcriptional regulator [Vibrio lentus]PME64478.1 transcriptional regulator [Vibrio lentus]PME95670.1 transcriptional regulator [Vibrio lentus]PMG68564.1 transcriptional regulator [Vibrio lentus]
MIYSPKQLADSMLLIRQKNNWSQTELAKRVGIKQSTISNFENNPNLTTLSTFFKLLQAMNLTLKLEEKSLVQHCNDNDEEDW